MGLSRVSLEQVLQWNPEVIIAEHKSIHDAIIKSPLWAGIEAVRRNRVYLTPRGPFCWFDRPAGASTIPGILWTAMKLYPQRFQDIDLYDLTRRFYTDFYHYQMTDAELGRLLMPQRTSDK
jgi:iron complex transport system substrate-binding protein